MKKKPNPTALLQKAINGLHPKKAEFPDFKVGDTVRVSVKVIEGEKTRVQVYEGLVIAMKRGGASACFTVRKISYGIGVERIFPFFSPVIEKVVIVSKGEVRRAKLYYLRALSGRASRIKSEQVFGSAAESSAVAGSTDATAATTGSATITAKAAQA
jgi:large subunit ribosomal protein L19